MDHRNVSRRTFLRATLVLGAGAAVSLMAACGGTPQTAPTAPPSKPAEAPKAAPAAGTSAKEIKLTAWFTDRRSINDMTEQQAIPEFQAKNPGIKVELQFVPEAQIQQKLL